MIHLVTPPAGAEDAMVACPQPGHALGPVKDDWEAADVVINAVKQRSRSTSGQTEATYRHHLAKLRWYCEHVGRITPSRWSAQDVGRFIAFLAKIPNDAISAPGTAAGEPGWTPFRRQPSDSSQADVVRFVHALFNAWNKMGYVRINPMGLSGTKNVRKVNAQRSISLDLYDAVLGSISRSGYDTMFDRLKAVRDRFVFEALRGLGLRASELVHARMNAFYQLSVPGNAERYWVFHVTEKTGKGGKERRIPVTQAVWDAFTTYRRAYSLPAAPRSSEQTRLILSPRTRGISIAQKVVKRSYDRRYLELWREVTTRQTIHAIVTGRLEQTANEMEGRGEHDAARRLRDASPHWLRHTFGKTSLLEGQNVREVAAALGHSSLETTMIYTEQDALDLIAAVERARPGTLARESLAA